MFRGYWQRTKGWVSREAWVLTTVTLVMTAVLSLIPARDYCAAELLATLVLLVLWTFVPPLRTGLTPDERVVREANAVVFRASLRARWPTYWRAAVSGVCIGLAASVVDSVFAPAAIAVLALVAAYLSFNAGLHLPMKPSRRKGG